MALKPTKPTVPPAPSRANPGVDFAAKADALAAFLPTLVGYSDDVATFVDGRADEALAAALGGTLPPLTGKALNYLRVNSGGSAAEFRTSAQVLGDLGVTPTGQSLIEAADAAAVRAIIGPSFIESLTTQTSTSGTSRDFVGIPDWVRRVTIIYVGVSLSGTAEALIQLGTSGGFETTNYIGTSITGSISVANQALSSGFRVYDNSPSAANLIHGKLILDKLGGANTWVASGHFTYGDTPEWRTVVGSKSLSGTLDRIRSTTTNGTDTHDAGFIGVSYE